MMGSLSLAQINGHERKSEEVLQRHKQELSQGGGRLESDDFEPSSPVKPESPADLIEITNCAFDSVLL
jgi:hypothetical protein